jgi:hypothetical protein
MDHLVISRLESVYDGVEVVERLNLSDSRSARANVGHARLCENFAVALEGKPHGNFGTRSGLAARRRYAERPQDRGVAGLVVGALLVIIVVPVGHRPRPHR